MEHLATSIDSYLTGARDEANDLIDWAFDCGYAMGSNPFPLIVPCHRVTRGSQMPGAYVGGEQRRLTLNHLEDAHA